MPRQQATWGQWVEVTPLYLTYRPMGINVACIPANGKGITTHM
jgi:hypothetical protein